MVDMYGKIMVLLNIAGAVANGIIVSGMNCRICALSADYIQIDKVRRNA